MAVQAAAAETCQQILTRRMSVYKNLLAQSGVVTISDCTTIAPYIHIVMINESDTRRQIILPVVPYSATAPKDNVKLISIANYANLAIAGVNGFMWDKGEGTAYGQQGILMGYVTSAGKSLGTNTRNIIHLVLRYNTLRNTSNNSYAGFGLNFLQGKEGNWNLGATNIASSTTSIIKISNVKAIVGSNSVVSGNYNCSTDAQKSRWSAIGGGKLDNTQGYTLMVSSTSSGETTAQELCPIFKAFNIPNAIRLDGGPSAAMVINKVLVNPLQGLYRIKYGESRNIAYPLLVK